MLGSKCKMRVAARGSTALVAAAVTMAAPAAANAAATITVEPTPGKNTFAPARVITKVSEAQFNWIWGRAGAGTTGFHDVVSAQQLFDSGEAIKQGTFGFNASAGKYPYFCSIHFGMAGRISVRPEAGEGGPGPFRVRWATDGSETGRRYDVRFKVGDGPWRIWQENTRKHSGIFNATASAKPSAPAGQRILIQARSENTERQASHWSPPLRITR